MFPSGVQAGENRFHHKQSETSHTCAANCIRCGFARLRSPRRPHGWHVHSQQRRLLVPHVLKRALSILPGAEHIPVQRIWSLCVTAKSDCQCPLCAKSGHWNSAAVRHFQIGADRRQHVFMLSRSSRWPRNHIAASRRPSARDQFRGFFTEDHDSL